MKATVYGLGCIGVIALVIAWPVIGMILGAFTGWVLSNIFIFAGNWLIDGMNLFHVEVTLIQLPLLTATLGFIGGFFKSSTSSSKK